MPKLSETYSKWKSIREGTTCYCFRTLLIRFGQVFREWDTSCWWCFSLSAVWHLLTPLVSRIKNVRRKHFVTLAKLVVAALVFDSIILQDLSPLSPGFIIASCKHLRNLISLVTWSLYRKKCHSSSNHHLFDAVWMIGFRLYSISPFSRCGGYWIALAWVLLGASSLQDSFFWKDENNPKLKRRMRMTLPILWQRWSLSSTLRKLNEWLAKS